MKAFKIVLLILLSLLDVYCIYGTIGYIILGNQTPRIIGETTTNFCGMYIMSATFLAIAVVITIAIIIIAVRLAKKR